MTNNFENSPSLNRRKLLLAGAATLALPIFARADEAEKKTSPSPAVIAPPEGKQILLSVKLTMITKKLGDQNLTLAQRLSLATDAGFDGVDLDEAASFTNEEARAAVAESGTFVHNAIDHAHWKMRLTSKVEAERKKAHENIAHCLRLSHAAGGSGVLIVLGSGADGSVEEVADRAREGVRKLLPLAAALGQPILFENVWNRMFYEHDKPAEQSAKPFIDFIDSFNSPWVGQYYDIGNHWKYGQPREWIHDFGRRCVKLDIKGFSRKAENGKGAFTEIGKGDLPWNEVQKALHDINFTGWATAEVGGGDVARLKIVHAQMVKALGL